ncbi:hypothetical protein AB0J63_19250 [Streptosporangium canum]|uniref:hypothetical protein n=1 Tax=Streptosporangium canum TaxID=324952 RepID=UPI0034472698
MPKPTFSTCATGKTRTTGDPGGIDHIGFDVADPATLQTLIDQIGAGGGTLLMQFPDENGLPTAFRARNANACAEFARRIHRPGTARSSSENTNGSDFGTPTTHRLTGRVHTGPNDGLPAQDPR